MKIIVVSNNNSNINVVINDHVNNVNVNVDNVSNENSC